MKSIKTSRGFITVMHPTYLSEPDTFSRLLQESSIIGDYEDSFDKPGSSCLWVGKDHHLNREEVQELVQKLQYWLDNKRLPSDEPITDTTGTNEEK